MLYVHVVCFLQAASCFHDKTKRTRRSRGTEIQYFKNEWKDGNPKIHASEHISRLNDHEVTKSVLSERKSLLLVSKFK